MPETDEKQKISWLIVSLITSGVIIVVALILSIPFASNYIGAMSDRDGALVAIFSDAGELTDPVCLKISGADPAPELLSAIQAKNPHIVPASDCRPAETGHGFTTSTHKDAFYVAVTDVRRVSYSQTTLRITNVSGYLFGSSSSIITIEFLNGKWVVTSERLASVS